MKIAFSTLGCPGWSFDEIFATARDLGIQGIEIRGIADTVYAPRCLEFSDENIEKTLSVLKRSGMEIPVLDTASVLGVPQRAEDSMREAKDYIVLASRLGTKYVRVMPSPYAEPSDCDVRLCRSLYTELCEFALDYGVVPLMETNGVFAESSVLAKFLDSIPLENKGALWDVHHPYRFFREVPFITVGTLGDRIKHTHLKDSVMVNGKVSYRMMGYGDVPLKSVLKELGRIGYKGYLSLEWLKRWNPELQEPGIVFAHFVSYMDYLASQI